MFLKLDYVFTPLSPLLPLSFFFLWEVELEISFFHFLHILLDILVGLTTFHLNKKYTWLLLHKHIQNDVSVDWTWPTKIHGHICHILKVKIKSPVSRKLSVTNLWIYLHSGDRISKEKKNYRSSDN